MRPILFFLFFSQVMFAQNTELKFAKYLYEKGFYKEALLELKLQQNLRSGKNDSILFYSGLCNSGLHLNDTAVFFWGQLDSLGPFFSYARMYSALYLLEIGKNKEAGLLLDNVPLTSELAREVIAYEFDAINFLGAKKNVQWSSTKSTFTTKLNSYQQTAQRYHRKKPFVGGLLSALLPGSGKIYAGKPRQFISTLLPIAFLGLQAWEGYRYSGFKSARFWVFGSIGTLFYLGNIYGSAIAVRVAKKEQYDLVKHQVFVDLRLALHDLYGQPWK